MNGIIPKLLKAALKTNTIFTDTVSPITVHFFSCCEVLMASGQNRVLPVNMGQVFMHELKKGDCVVLNT